MRWGKVILIIQAALTLIIGMAFFTQVIKVDNETIDKIKFEIKEEGININEALPPGLQELKHRYTIAAYILFIVSVLELLIISRLSSS